MYEGCFDDQPQQFRGQTGAQDNIIPTMDIFTGIVDHYPDNKLTEYLLDLRTYRPVCIQNFFTDLRSEYSLRPIFSELERAKDVNGLVYLLEIVDEVYLFRNGHWSFIQAYIMRNTAYAKATGGTPIISWVPNQIRCVLQYEDKIIQTIDRLTSIDYYPSHSLTRENDATFRRLKEVWKAKTQLLDEQTEELTKRDYIENKTDNC